MHIFVAVTGVIGAVTLSLSPRLRLHGAAVLGSGLCWALLYAVYIRYVPAIIHEGGTMMRFEFYCCPWGLGTLHVLLSVALGVGIVRESLRKKPPSDDGKEPPRAS